MKENWKILFQLDGNADDLLMINRTKTIKSTRLIDVAPDSDAENEEVMDFCVTSTNECGDFPKFDQMIDRKIRLTVEVCDRD